METQEQSLNRQVAERVREVQVHANQAGQEVVPSLSQGEVEKIHSAALRVFIEDTESRMFRTHHDTGANPNALVIWNMVRRHAGLQPLRREDLVERTLVDLTEQAVRAMERGDVDGVRRYAESYKKIKAEEA